MNKILNNNIFLNLINVIILLLVFLFIFSKFQFAYIHNDDILDLINNRYAFLHGRFITELLSTFILVQLPSFFNVNIQNFAIISEGLFKSIIFAILVYVVNLSLMCFKIKKVFFPILLIFSFFVLFFISIDTLNFQCYTTLQFFSGYIIPVIFFSLLFYKIADIYLNNKNMCTKDFVLLFILFICNAMGNEIFLFFSLSFTFFLLLDSFVTNRLKKEMMYFFLFSILSSIVVLSSDGFIDMFKLYNHTAEKITLSIEYSTFKDFICLYIKKVVFENFQYIFIVLISFLSLFFVKDENNKVKHVQKIGLYFCLSFLFFFSSLYFLGQTYAYSLPETDLNSPLYWIHHFPLQVDFRIALYIIFLYFIGFIFSLKQNKKNKIFIFLILILFLSSITFKYYKNNYNEILFYSLENKELIYKIDKMSIHYLKKEKPAILPLQDMEVILPFWSVLNQKEVADNNYKNKVFKIEDSPNYLFYLYTVYKVDVDAGMIFMDKESAYQNYFEDGGFFTEEEMKKLDFSSIMM